MRYEIRLINLVVLPEAAKRLSGIQPRVKKFAAG